MSLPEFAQAFSRPSRRGQNLPVQIQFQELAREAVHHVYVLLADLKRAGQSGIFHLFDERSVLVENLNPLIFPVGDPELSLGVQRDRVRDIEFPGRRSLPTPGLDECSVLVEFQYARISLAGAVSLDDKKISPLRPKARSFGSFNKRDPAASFHSPACPLVPSVSKNLAL